MTEQIQETKRKKQLSYPAVKFDDPGDSFIGKILDRKTREINERQFGVYTVVDSDGTRWTLFGTLQLDNALDNADEDALLEIIYTGSE